MLYVPDEILALGALAFSFFTLIGPSEVRDALALLVPAERLMVTGRQLKGLINSG